jgi:GntR family transcriptional regulator, transcriptional repressor for pyruvate dehydrogenase complex
MQPLEPRQRLYQDAVTAIRQYVVDQRLQPGDLLPSERQIQEQLGISRAPVREALRSLQSLGIIESRQGKGLFVKQLDLRPMVDTFVSHLELIDRESFHQLLQLRQILELGASELAAKFRTEQDLRRMAKIVAATKARISRGEDVRSVDMGFHDALVAATHNPLIEHLYSCMEPFLLAVRESGELNDGVLAECLEYHMLIYTAVRDQDPARSVRLMQAHMDSVRLQLKDERLRQGI